MNTESPRAHTARTLPEQEFFYGHKACAGCGGGIAVRLALKALGPRAVSILPANCMSAVSFIYPQMAFTGNAMIAPFPATAAMLSGVAAATRALGLSDVPAVGFAGDGGTADIGLQALSGAIDRRERIIYICYDNEAYMNTGIQKSGLTPYGSRTTTTPAGKNLPGSVRPKKNMFEIVAAHGIDYAATCSIGYPQDYLNKLAKAARCPGTAYLHIYATCPTGWGTPSESAVELAREAVTCGLWYLAEYENGAFRLNRNPAEFTPLADHLLRQGRFRHLEPAVIAEIEAQRDARWQHMRRCWT